MITTLIQRVNLNMLTGVQQIMRPTNFWKNRDQYQLVQRVASLVSDASPFLLKEPTRNLPTAIDIGSYCMVFTCFSPVRIHSMKGV
jgi:hypothetical protein